MGSSALPAAGAAVTSGLLGPDEPDFDVGIKKFPKKFAKILQVAGAPGGFFETAEGLPQFQQFFQLRQQLGAQALQGLSAPGALPSDVESSIRQQVVGSLAARGIEGSPAAAVAEAARFLGASEDIRSRRLSQAQSILQGVGNLPTLPSGSEFLSALTQGRIASFGPQAALFQSQSEAAGQLGAALFGGFGQEGGAEAGPGAQQGAGGLAGLKGGGGAAGGAPAGGAGLASAFSPFCWLAEAVYGRGTPGWLFARTYITEMAPTWQRRLYGRFGPALANLARKSRVAKFFLRPIVAHFAHKGFNRWFA